MVIGIGNEYRGDDAAGLLVAAGLEAACAGVRVVGHTGDGLALIEAWGDAGTVILVDAAVSGAPPGTIHRLDGGEPVPREWFGASTHLFNVAEAIELAKILGRQPRRLLVYGIEGRSFAVGAPVSPEVRSAARRVVEDLLSLLASSPSASSSAPG